MFRVAQGKSWVAETVQQQGMSSLRFGPSPAAAASETSGPRFGLAKHVRNSGMAYVDFERTDISSMPTTSTSFHSTHLPLERKKPDSLDMELEMTILPVKEPEA